MTVTQLEHVVVFPAFYWGHIRPMCTLVARMAKLRPIVITFLPFASLHDRVKAELPRDFQPGEEGVASRIRVVALQDGTEEYHSSGAPGALKAAWQRIVEQQPLTCAKTDEQLEALLTPRAALIDFFAPEAYEAVREISGHQLKVYSWYPCATNSIFRLLGKDLSPGDNGTATPNNDGSQNDTEIIGAINGSIVRSPCLPPMYDYELHPQAYMHSAELINKLIVKIPGVLATTDGFVTIDAADFQPKATAEVRKALAETSRRMFYAGPLLPSGQQAVRGEKQQSQNGNEIMAFLDEKLAICGERSVVYISFGSLFWPSDPEKIWAVLEVLMERNLPFVMSHAAEFAGPVPEKVKDMVAGYGNGIISDWVPQQALLEHPATGWYLMHGGHNGTLEAIMAGVPMIVWPITADQPLNAVYLTDEANVAYELVEVRHGIGLGKIYRNGVTPTGTIDAVKDEMRGVLEKAFGEDGAEKRAKLQVLRKKLQAAWEEEGVARREVEAFLDSIL
ncbi:UDP-Glycosyltransferase/glycogen phosphorylase [Trametes cingulata]|nr:UDP-Glycosyltransferase/glycogen phosphorylase [Trametes cingulata]